MNTYIADIFLTLDAAIKKGRLIHRESQRDKEYHFQDWFQARLTEASVRYQSGGRNTYPAFSLVDSAEGFEVKGLAHPGRYLNYDANSQMPTGWHDGLTIYYVFGRYPRRPTSDQYPVHDLVVCHGDLLNADREYSHQNKSLREFGTFGDIMIRDRKMYVAPTPFALLDGTEGRRTLILPQSDSFNEDPRFQVVGTFSRSEADKALLGYQFNLVTNELTPQFADNPNKGRQHNFIAYRASNGDAYPVNLKDQLCITGQTPSLI